jgi:hypothetical protein
MAGSSCHGSSLSPLSSCSRPSVATTSKSERGRNDTVTGYWYVSCCLSPCTKLTLCAGSYHWASRTITRTCSWSGCSSSGARRPTLSRRFRATSRNLCTSAVRSRSGLPPARELFARARHDADRGGCAPHVRAAHRLRRGGSQDGAHHDVVQAPWRERFGLGRAAEHNADDGQVSAPGDSDACGRRATAAGSAVGLRLRCSSSAAWVYWLLTNARSLLR